MESIRLNVIQNALEATLRHSDNNQELDMDPEGSEHEYTLAPVCMKNLKLNKLFLINFQI